MVISQFPSVAFCGVLLLSSPSATAVICTPVPHYRFVGTDLLACSDHSIQAAIDNVVCPGTIVVITQDYSYTSQALLISDKSLVLAGAAGAKCGTAIGVCDPTVGCGGGGGVPLPPAVTLTGTGSSPVITIEGTSSVTLQSLEITGGGGSAGGGVKFSGAGMIALVDSSIVSNSASFGGGIYVSGASDTNLATLTLNPGTIIQENTANADGGGIYLAANTRMLALAPYTFIAYNHAPNGYGGGIAIEGPPPAQADIGSPGYNGGPVIEFNDASYGGGIALVAQPPQNQGYAVQARLFTTDPNSPGAISSNTATQGGGGIYVVTTLDSSASPPNSVPVGFCAANFRIDGNVAPEGAAIYSDALDIKGTVYYGASVDFNPSYQCADNYSTTLASLGGQGCAAGTSCNTVNNNASLDASSQPTSGAALFANRGTYFKVDRFTMRFNQGGHAIYLVGTEPANIEDCLLADNNESAELISAFGAAVDIDSCTIANNTLGGASVIYDDTSVNPYNILQDSIIDQPGFFTLNAGSKLNTLFLLSNDLSTLPYGDNIAGAPTYVNAAAGDYHLQITSLGVDYAAADSYPQGTEPALDLDGKPRAYDIPTVKNVWGPRDLGAYERSPACYRADTVLCDGFEGVF